MVLRIAGFALQAFILTLLLWIIGKIDIDVESLQERAEITDQRLRDLEGRPPSVSNITFPVVGGVK